METISVIIVLAVVVGLAAVWQWRLHRTWQRKFNERFPAISDEEFLSRCSPGIPPEIALKVRRTISDAYGIDYERIHPSARLIDDLSGDV